MILAVTGFHFDPFDRMVRMVDELAERLHETVVVQKGVSTVEPRIAMSYDWLDEASFAKHLNEARIVICHGGVGTIIEARKFGKPVIVIPRRAEFGEHVDNHQVEIAEALSASGAVLCANTMTELLDAVTRVTQITWSSQVQKKNRLIVALELAVKELSEGAGL